MRKLDAALLTATAIMLAVSAHPAWAKSAKSNSSLMKASTTGTHYKEATITARTTTKTKPKSGKAGVSDIPVTKTMDKSSP